MAYFVLGSPKSEAMSFNWCYSSSTLLFTANRCVTGSTVAKSVGRNEAAMESRIAPNASRGGQVELVRSAILMTIAQTTCCMQAIQYLRRTSLLIEREGVRQGRTDVLRTVGTADCICSILERMFVANYCRWLLFGGDCVGRNGRLG